MARIGRTYPARPLVTRVPLLPPPAPPPPSNPAVFAFSAPRTQWEFGAPQTTP